MNTDRERLEGTGNSPSPGSELYQRALRVLPGGCSRNAILRRPHPIYAVRGSGCHVIDVEGVRRIDFANNMGSLIHGHAHPAVIDAVSEQIRLGTAFNVGTEVEIVYAEHMCARVPGFEKIRFVNSGTEAVMCALKVARAFTGRPMIAKVEGAYHGFYDYAEVSETANPTNWGNIDSPASVPVAHGTPSSLLEEVVVIPFNDPDRAIAILDRHADKLACLLIDLVPHRIGFIPAERRFVDALWEWTRANGVLMVCDEVVTFRTTYTGAQADYGIRPDLTAMGKIIGGGFPVGALAGRNDVMSVLDPLEEKVRVPHSGTFSANPVTMVAGRVAMELFDESAVARLNRLGDMARSTIGEAIRLANVPASVTGTGSVFRIHLKPEPPRSYREAYATPEETKLKQNLLNHLTDRGILLISTGSGVLSTAMTEKEIDTLATAVLSGLKETFRTI
jgi:glutamate-1-semialdehyde 2,1-aminomutase